MYNIDMEIQIVNGGLTHCTPAWRKPGPEPLYKVYWIHRGSGWVQSEGRQTPLRSGHAYFLDGHRLDAYGTADAMEVQWVHVIPQSLSLAASLRNVPVVVDWPGGDIPQWLGVLRRLGEYVEVCSIADDCRLQGVLLSMLGDVLARADGPGAHAELLERFAPAIRYMDEHAIDQPSLQAVADQVGLSAEHFHRRFRSAFETTPHAYMETRRMSRARQQLLSGRQTVAEVARACGYQCPFYFSRAFKRYYGVSPSHLRHAASP